MEAFTLELADTLIALKRGTSVIMVKVTHSESGARAIVRMYAHEGLKNERFWISVEAASSCCGDYLVSAKNFQSSATVCNSCAANLTSEPHPSFRGNWAVANGGFKCEWVVWEAGKLVSKQDFSADWETWLVEAGLDVLAATVLRYEFEQKMPALLAPFLRAEPHFAAIPDKLDLVAKLSESDA